MSVYKCKMCGGDLDLIDDQTTVFCDYCGTRQTVPKVDDERKTNMFNRANLLRQDCKFDMAAGIYSTIVIEYPEEAEGYWGLVLCKYGIEYVDDPRTHKKIPTCHRSSFESLMDDVDYHAAFDKADVSARAVYREEAVRIENIRKHIISISHQEKPYDVFICFKNEDGFGYQTEDREIAEDVYRKLTGKGYRVFFSPESLRGKEGKEYEPYIFSALNSAKIMLVFGTKKEYMEAVWVKNEWSRFLHLMERGVEKQLFTCFKDIKPAEMPPELGKLQGFDLALAYSMQGLQDKIDSILGIEKAQEQEALQRQEGQKSVADGPTIDSLLKRVEIFLEEEEWNSASTYCEKVLDIDPENAKAYLGKLMIDLRVNKEEKLAELKSPFDEKNDYKKAVRYADKELENRLTGYITRIKERNELNRLKLIYKNAQNSYEIAKRADNAERYKEAQKYYAESAQLFEDISEYLDAAALGMQCRELAQNAMEQDDLRYCKNNYSEASYKLRVAKDFKARHNYKLAQVNFEEAAKQFKKITHYEDSKQLAEECLESAKLAVQEGKLYTLECSYIKAKEAMEVAVTADDYKQCMKDFSNISEYKDSEVLSKQCYEAVSNVKCYEKASSLEESDVLENLEEAKELFEQLAKISWKDSEQRLEQCKNHIKAKKSSNKKRNIGLFIICILVGAVIYFIAVVVPNNKYNDAMALKDAGKMIEAYDSLVKLGSYKDSQKQASAIYEEYREEINFEKIKSAKVGDYVIFGSYEQDNTASNGAEDIEWKVLEVKDGKVLLVSKYGLDCQTYNKKQENITWETCTLRIWLNDTFLNTAFSENEKALIPAVMISADENPYYSTNPGNSTKDQIFLLSIAEVNKYFSSNVERGCKATAYAKEKGGRDGKEDEIWWWLRSPGGDQDAAAGVMSGGGISGIGFVVNIDWNAVRPALWVDLNADVF